MQILQVLYIVLQVCNKEFAWLSNYRRHVRIVHENIKPHKCHKCGHRFISTTHLKRHQQKICCSTVLKCQFCSETFTSKDLLKVHMETHPDEKEFRCPLCKTNFSTQKLLISHQRVHSDDKKFSCQICLKSFKYKESLQAHLNVHQKIKPFECKDCNQCFHRQSNLSAHTRRIHRRLTWNGQCKKCGHLSSDKSALRKHMQQCGGVQRRKENEKKLGTKNKKKLGTDTNTKKKGYICQV